MTVTVASFRGAFPVFASPTDYPDPMVQMWIDVGTQRHNPDRWGTLLDTGVMLFVAHNLTLEYNSTKGAAGGQGPGAAVGAVTSMSADDASWTRQAVAMDPKDGQYALTTYGLRWREMAKMMGAGGLHIGVPGPCESGGYGAWPGPFPSPF